MDLVPGSEPPRRRGGLIQIVGAVVIVLAIFWLAAFFALRTQTGHDAVVARLQRGLGRELTVGATRLVPPLAMTVADVASVDFTVGEQGVRADLLAFSVGIRPWLRVRVVRPEANLVYDGSGWTPVRLAGLGELPGNSLGGLSALCDEWIGHAALSVEDGTINWHDEQGGLAAFAEHVNYMRRRVVFPEREAWFQRLQVTRAQTPGAPVVEAAQVEWLSVDSNRYVEITRSGSLPSAATAGFWGAGP